MGLDRGGKVDWDGSGETLGDFQASEAEGDELLSVLGQGVDELGQD